MIPACDFDTALGSSTRGWQSSCDLKFGTSVGAVGFRKFPNPRFDREKWLAQTQKSGGIDLGDASLEPPFRFGISCASCHASFDPVNPPKNVNKPNWFNINTTIGNQYLMISQIFASGFAKNSLEYQTFAHSRPGTVDTSVFPNDQIHNPGTMNPIMNLGKRPVFNELVETWRRTQTCTDTSRPSAVMGQPRLACTCNESGTRCYEKSKHMDTVFHELKGGEDSTGVINSILRVYLNIGTCSETCWLNHLTDLHVLDKSARNYGETPVDIGQCRRDCSNFRALEDRVELERDFLVSAEPRDLVKAMQFQTEKQLEDYIEGGRGFGEGSVRRGEKVYTQNCAGCHSSVPEAERGNYLSTDNQGRRRDWLGSDERIKNSSIGTFDCRARHTNHLKNHIWSPYSSDNVKAQGLGFYRAPSLLSSWAFAPFLHNNALGPAETFDPSVMGRLKLFEASMQSLLHPELREHKILLTTDEVRIPLVSLSGNIDIVIPKGVRVARLGSFRHKDFFNDLIIAVGDRLPWKTNGKSTLPVANTNSTTTRAKEMSKALAVSDIFSQILFELTQSTRHEIRLDEARLEKLGEIYSNCSDTIEDQGHVFGNQLSEGDKKDLTAFMETL